MFWSWPANNGNISWGTRTQWNKRESIDHDEASMVVHSWVLVESGWLVLDMVVVIHSSSLIGVLGCVHGYQLVTSCTNWNLKNIDHYQCWLVLGCVHPLPVGLILCSVHRQFDSALRSLLMRPDRTGLDWTHNPHPPWLGLCKVTPCEQGVPEVSAPHVRRRALTSGTSCSSCLALWAYYPV